MRHGDGCSGSDCDAGNHRGVYPAVADYRGRRRIHPRAADCRGHRANHFLHCGHAADAAPGALFYPPRAQGSRAGRFGCAAQSHSAGPHAKVLQQDHHVGHAEQEAGSGVQRAGCCGWAWAVEPGAATVLSPGRAGPVRDGCVAAGRLQDRGYRRSRAQDRSGPQQGAADEVVHQLSGRERAPLLLQREPAGAGRQLCADPGEHQEGEGNAATGGGIADKAGRSRSRSEGFREGVAAGTGNGSSG